MSIKEKIEETLKQKFQPEILEVINESYKHAGHSGDNGTGESHFKIVISADDVAGKTRLEKHRNINAALGSFVKEIHAIGIELK